ncbi:FAD-dependent oxidoreductase [Desulfosarcina ovata]|uniref:FAD/NAD(P)-binding domain-containing protein n=1 Tax=Desulfosarcina ovata subsp. ovata TaxID=2752305 RepID=A0A5K8AFV9_9BACT|nr:FAD-dependent oxidoreductase [Desulfosarcina ovata]BBO91572.1 hypothetical protein DSCOOX_47520 [Desulfosarcina ovata subsp. ovata]
MSKSYDVLIIGSGTAGQTAAYQLNDNGIRIGLVEQSPRPGGTCALSGCQAKKWFYEGAEKVRGEMGRFRTGNGYSSYRVSLL